jgi:hypothetical protein
MLVNMRHFFLCVAILFIGLFSTTTFAADRGLYRCTGGCETPKPFEANESSIRTIFWVAFIKSDVNPVLNSPKWNESDTVQICNGDVCITFYYNFGNWYTRNAVPDTGQQTREDAVKRTRKTSLDDTTQCRGSGRGSYVADGSGGYLTGYYQWYDYYTNNNYDYSSPREFVPTGYFPGPGVPWNAAPGGGLKNCT